VTAPKVSSLIPCFNAQEHIAQALASALAQTYKPLEVIVVDDGSTDESHAVLSAFAPQIRIHKQANKGANVARNQLLQMAQGDWLQYLDADDYLAPTKFSSQLQCAVLENKTNISDGADVLFGPVKLHSERTQPPSFTQLDIPTPEAPWALMAAWRIPQTGGLLWRRSALTDVGGWMETQQRSQDNELHLRLLRAGKQFLHTPCAGAFYRDWSNNTISRRDLTQNRATRLELVTRTQDIMKEAGLMTPSRRAEKSRSRFELARVIWPENRQWATTIVQSIASSDPNFVPPTNLVPSTYTWLYRHCSFTTAERVAALKRALLPSRQVMKKIRNDAH